MTMILTGGPVSSTVVAVEEPADGFDEALPLPLLLHAAANSTHTAMSAVVRSRKRCVIEALPRQAAGCADARDCSRKVKGPEAQSRRKLRLSGQLRGRDRLHLPTPATELERRFTFESAAPRAEASSAARHLLLRKVLVDP